MHLVYNPARLQQRQYNYGVLCVLINNRLFGVWTLVCWKESEKDRRALGLWGS
ncbi:MAG: hypothetical protein ACI9UT_002546 [Flavobacteriales bacterium]|jgi:hypothetical protein